MATTLNGIGGFSIHNDTHSWTRALGSAIQKPSLMAMGRHSLHAAECSSHENCRRFHDKKLAVATISRKYYNWMRCAEGELETQPIGECGLHA